MTKIAFLLGILLSGSANAACLPSIGTVVPSARSPSVIWDIQMPGHSYRISAYGNFIAIRENGSWKRTDYRNVLSFRPNAANMTTCKISRILRNFHSNPELWM